MSNDNGSKTELIMALDKTIMPKQYEPIKIHVSIKEEFTWDSKENRDLKIKEYRNMILNDFVECFNAALEKIGEKDRCIGHIGPKEDKKNVDKKQDNDEFDF